MKLPYNPFYKREKHPYHLLPNSPLLFLSFFLLAILLFFVLNFYNIPKFILKFISHQTLLYLSFFYWGVTTALFNSLIYESILGYHILLFWLWAHTLKTILINKLKSLLNSRHYFMRGCFWFVQLNVCIWFFFHLYWTKTLVMNKPQYNLLFLILNHPIITVLTIIFFVIIKIEIQVYRPTWNNSWIWIKFQLLLRLLVFMILVFFSYCFIFFYLPIEWLLGDDIICQFFDLTIKKRLDSAEYNLLLETHIREFLEKHNYLIQQITQSEHKQKIAELVELIRNKGRSFITEYEQDPCQFNMNVFDEIKKELVSDLNNLFEYLEKTHRETTGGWFNAVLGFSQQIKKIIIDTISLDPDLYEDIAYKLIKMILQKVVDYYWKS